MSVVAELGPGESLVSGVPVDAEPVVSGTPVP